MNEKSEALAYSQLLLLHADTITDSVVKEMVVNSAAELTILHLRVEALRRDAFRKGFYAGFAATGEGWNGEYPFQDKNRPIAGDPSVEAAIDAAMKEGT